MEFHLGRLIDHVHLRVSDLEAAKRFYGAVIASLGRSGSLVEGDGFFHIDELFVDKADGPVSRVHLAFQAPDRETVAAFHRAGQVRAVATTVRPVSAPTTPVLWCVRPRSRREQHRGRVSRKPPGLPNL
jgi:catechol 2,3-dioxygenase-like lactoylglutathione lyase family enzyme